MEGQAQTSPAGCQRSVTPLHVCPCQDLHTGGSEAVTAEMLSTISSLQTKFPQGMGLEGR